MWYSITQCVLHIAQCVLHIAQCVLHITQCVLHITQCVLHITHYTLHSVYSIHTTYLGMVPTKPVIVQNHNTHLQVSSTEVQGSSRIQQRASAWRCAIRVVATTRS